MTRIPVDQNAAESIPGAAFAAADRHAVSSVSTSERDERCGIAWRRAHDITGPVNAWTRFRSHRDLSVEGVMCLDLDFLARRHLDDRRDALVPAVVSHKLNDERSVWRPA